MLKGRDTNKNMNLVESEGHEVAKIETVIECKPTPLPIADEKTSVKVLDMLEQANHFKQLKRGTNEVMKILLKSKASIVILAADTQPLELLMTIPELCEERSISYCYVPSSAALGRACGIKR